MSDTPRDTPAKQKAAARWNLVHRPQTFLKRLACKIGWHSAAIKGSDGLSFHAECRWCGYQGLLDSNGDLF